MLDGLLNLSLFGIVVYTLLLTHITIAAVTIFLHRHQAHRALELHPAVSHFFRFWLWLTTGIVTREWVAVHRRHHVECETPEDPHSPQIVGLRKVLLEGAELYRQAARDAANLERYGRGTPDDRVERLVYTGRRNQGLVLMLAIDLLLCGIIGLSVWAVQMLWIPLFAAGVINGAGHAIGYRNHQSPDASTNIVPWGILIGGEELHNNHHAHPGSARLSFRPWEIDLGWIYIRLLASLGLARVKRVAPPPARVTAETDVIDRGTVRAIVEGRYQVLADYSRNVMRRIAREERRKPGPDRGALFKRVGRMVMQEESLLAPQSQAQLRRALDCSAALRTAYGFRASLLRTWNDPRGPEAVGQALHEWCQQAEATGIGCLQEFAKRLRGYRMTNR